MPDQYCCRQAAQAYAEAARLDTLLAQRERLRQTGNSAGSAAAHYGIAATVARLYKAAAYLPADHPAGATAHQALDQVDVTFEPDAPSPHPAYSLRLELLAAAAAVHRLADRIKNEPDDPEMRCALAARAVAEMAQAAQAAQDLPPLPERHGWSKRQARAFDAEVHSALKQAQKYAQEAVAAQREAMPYVVMPELAARGLNNLGRENMLKAINRHHDDRMHVLITKPDRNADGETPFESAAALVFQQRRYLKTIDEDFPSGYPEENAIDLLAGAARQLEEEAQRCREPDNRNYCRAAARRARQALERIQVPERIQVAGRITQVDENAITITSVTQAEVPPALRERARGLLEQEVVVPLAIKDGGDHAVTAIIAAGTA